MGWCTAIMIWWLTGTPRGTVVIVPKSALQGYSARQIERGRRCCESRGIICRVDENK
jgi:hypothetical protein